MKFLYFYSKQGINNIGVNIGGSFIYRGVKFTMLDAKHSSVLDIVEEPLPAGDAASFLITLEDGTNSSMQEILDYLGI